LDRQKQTECCTLAYSKKTTDRKSWKSASPFQSLESIYTRTSEFRKKFDFVRSETLQIYQVQYSYLNLRIFSTTVKNETSNLSKLHVTRDSSGPATLAISSIQQ